VVVAVVILFTVIVMAPLFFYLPKVALAAIIVVAAVGLMELEDLFFLYKVRAWKALALLVITFVCTFALGVELGLLISLGISVLLLIQQSSVPNIALLGNVPGTRKYKDVRDYERATQIPGFLIVRFEDSLYFANVGQVKEALSRIERLGSQFAHPSEPQTNQQLYGIIMDARNVYQFDASALHTLLQIVEDYRERHIKVCFVKLRAKIKTEFLISGIISSLEGEQVFFSTAEAVDYLLQGPYSVHSSYVSEV